MNEQDLNWYIQKMLDILGGGSTGELLVPDTASLKFKWQSGDIPIGDNVLITADGGFAIPYINRTGHSSVRGEVVQLSSTADREVNLEDSGGINPMGIIYNAGIAEGSNVWVVTSGRVEVWFDASGAIKGGWVETSNLTAGRADGSAASPKPAPDHFEEIGHAEEAAAANALGFINLHFL